MTCITFHRETLPNESREYAGKDVRDGMTSFEKDYDIFLKGIRSRR